MRRVMGVALLAVMSAGASAAPSLARSHNAAALAAAEHAVAEMRSLARTPQERTLTQQDAAVVARLRTLLVRRDHRSRQATGAMGDSGPIDAAPGDAFESPRPRSPPLAGLHLQQHIKRETRALALVSPAMKARHDTVKGSVAAVR